MKKFTISIWQYIALVLNAFVAATGLFPVTSGVLGVLSPNVMDTNKQEIEISVVVTWIFIGIMIIIISCLGWYSIIKKSKPLLTMYIGLLSIVCIVIIGVAFLYFNGYKGTTEESLHLPLQAEYDTYYISAEAREFLSRLHTRLRCCGVFKPTKLGNFYPRSCCETLANNTCTNPYTTGCLSVYTKDLKRKNFYFGMATLFVACVDMLAVYAALFLSSFIAP